VLHPACKLQLQIFEPSPVMIKAHPDDWMIHNRSMALARGWWDQATVPDALDDGVWWWITPHEKQKRGKRSRTFSLPAGTRRAKHGAAEVGGAPESRGKYRMVRRAPPRVAEKEDGPVPEGIGFLEAANLKTVLGNNWKHASRQEWRFGVPELREGRLPSLPFICAKSRYGCRTPEVLRSVNISAIANLPLGRHGEAFNPSLAQLTVGEAAKLGQPNARYIATARQGRGQQCTQEDATTADSRGRKATQHPSASLSASSNSVSNSTPTSSARASPALPATPNPNPNASNSSAPNFTHIPKLSTIAVVLLDAQLRTLISTELLVSEPNCQGTNSNIEDCRLFRFAHPDITPPVELDTSGASVVTSMWLSCACHSWDFSRKDGRVPLSAPFVSPLSLSPVPGKLQTGSSAGGGLVGSPLGTGSSTVEGGLLAELKPGVGGFLFAEKQPEGGRWRGGNGQRNQLLFEHVGQLYAHWSLSPHSVVVQVPLRGPTPSPLQRVGILQGQLCCAQPVALPPPVHDLPVGGLELGGVGEQLRLSAGFVHLKEQGLLLGIAHTHRDLWRKGSFTHVQGRRRGREGAQLPNHGTHYTHLFFALDDKVRVALLICL